MAYAAGVFRAALKMPDEESRDRAVSFARWAGSVQGIQQVLALLGAIKPVSHPGGGWDTDPLLLMARNCVVDLRNASTRLGAPADMITMCAAAEYPQENTLESCCPDWCAFHSEVLSHHEELVEYSHRALGYSISGVTREQVFFLLPGSGSNGKSTLLETIAETLGDYAWSAPPSTFDYSQKGGIPNDLASLKGKRFILALSEASAHGETRLNEPRIKQFVGEDTVTARRLFQEYEAFQPVGKLWLAVNHPPRIHDDSRGMWRRVRVIPFERTFPIDTFLRGALRREHSGILHWLVAGFRKYQGQGLDAPTIVLEATKEYRESSDPLWQFVAECCEESEDWIPAHRLYVEYQTWCSRRGISAREQLSTTVFG